MSVARTAGRARIGCRSVLYLHIRPTPGHREPSSYRGHREKNKIRRKHAENEQHAMRHYAQDTWQGRRRGLAVVGTHV